MGQTLLMERVMDQTRLAVIEDGALCELYHRRPNSQDLTGNIYLGRVENVLPGMNAAFVDIGLEKKGFMSAGDIRLFAQGDKALCQALGRARIEKSVRPGQDVLVQVVKSQPGGKGPRLSGHITLTGRLTVLLTDVEYVGVSRKIGDEATRTRLRELGTRLMSEGGMGLILRTAARDADDATIAAEYESLASQAAELRARAEHLIAPRQMHDDNAMELRAVRDMLNENVDAIWVDDIACHGRLIQLAGKLAPQFSDRIRLHEGQTPLFDLYRVDAQADKALDKFVWLKSGGSLVIQETEAFTAVDVNTGKNVGKRGADETILETNREAAEELVRQLRLRDIGGIIVADFIDMKRESDRQELLALLRECAVRDRNHTTVVDITPLGLVELTRKKARQSLSQQLTHSCSHCGGNGTVASHEATARRVIRELWRRRRAGDMTPMRIEAAPNVCGMIRQIGVPEGGPVSLKSVAGMEAGEYRLSLADGKETE